MEDVESLVRGLGIAAGTATYEIYEPAVGRVLAHVPEAGHNIRRDQLGPYIDVIRSFLSAHPAATGAGTG